MACACKKNRSTPGTVTASVAGTYRVMVNGRKVYESTNEQAAGAVATRFQDAKILTPGQDS